MRYVYELIYDYLEPAEGALGLFSTPEKAKERAAAWAEKMAAAKKAQGGDGNSYRLDPLGWNPYLSGGYAILSADYQAAYYIYRREIDPPEEATP